MEMHRPPDIAREIQDAQLEVASLEDQVDVARRKVKTYEQETFLEVVQLVNEQTGKPLLTNESTREASQIARLQMDDNYQSLMDSLRALTLKRKEAQAKLERLQTDLKFLLLAWEERNTSAAVFTVRSAMNDFRRMVENANPGEVMPLKRHEAPF